MKKVFYYVIPLLFISIIARSQTRLVTGVVSEKDGGTPVAGANVTVKGTSVGTLTDAAGKFSLNVPDGSKTLLISFISFKTVEYSITDSNVVNISLESDSKELEEVIISVGRGSQRTITDSPVPIDNINLKDLSTTGQPTFDKALQYRVPSFNSVNTPVNDATSLFDPYELRNLGPSRTLILINGKRKNLTSLVYTATSPGRGETGADLSAIPQDAIKRVEILRDGASAQYGSDAIAGVMNIILKDRFDASSLRLTSGVTSKGDGFNYGINYNSGANIGEKGYINYHLSFLRQERAVRSGNIDPVAESSTAVGFGDGTQATTDNITNFLSKYPTGKNINGTTDNTSAKFLINTAIPLNDKTEFYANAAYVYRKALSFANYRQPYWKLDYGLLHTPDPSAPDYSGTGLDLYKGYIGYQPTFEGDLNDYNATLGMRTVSESGWKQDISLTTGGNKMLFTVNNTVNHSLQANSPISFKPGGFAFHHIVGNVDISKALTSKIYLGLGSEFRSENYQEIAGDTASYSGQGSNSFPGFSSKNAINASRYNLGSYVDLGFDITENWFVGLTGRTEKYSDFGNANVGKISSRLKLFDSKFTLRSSLSNGFKAPTLHQYNLTLNQAVGLSAGGVTIQGLANNYSREAALLGIPKLKAEKSVNFTAGMGFNPTHDFSFTLDYYYIDIKDRIVYSAQVKTGVSPQLDALLATANATGISFFINGAHTKTQGLDGVASYHNIAVGPYTLNLNLAANYVLNNKLAGSIATPPLIANAGGSIFTKTEEALMLTSRPKYKVILGGELVMNKLNITLNNSLVGPAYFSNVAYADFVLLDGNAAHVSDIPSDPTGHTIVSMLDCLKTTFQSRILTDISIGFELSKQASISIMVNNIFNMYPKYKIQAINTDGQTFLKSETEKRLLVGDLTFDGRYPYQTYDGAHINQLGTTFLGQLTYKF